MRATDDVFGPNMDRARADELLDGWAAAVRKTIG